MSGIWLRSDVAAVTGIGGLFFEIKMISVSSRLEERKGGEEFRVGVVVGHGRLSIVAKVLVLVDVPWSRAPEAARCAPVLDRPPNLLDGGRWI